VGGAALRTPDACFDALPDFPYEPRYVEVDGLRMAWVEDGPADGPVVLCLHGEPTWSFLYRSMLPVLAGAGLRAVAPDLVGFGRSDKPTDPDAYSYAAHVGWVRGFVEALGLTHLTLFVQDWGGLLGLRLAAEHPDDVDRLVIANTALPVGESPSEGFDFWRAFSQEVDPFEAGRLVQGASHRTLRDDEVAAYDAPFPDAGYQVGARRFPLLVPVTPDDPAVPANRAAWDVLRGWTKPALTLWAPNDPVLGNQHATFLDQIPGTAGLAHVTYDHASHFIQEDVGVELARATIDLITST
jgi:haloalkane dehalogenase